MSIENIYEVLEYADKLDKNDLILLQDHLCLIRNTKFPVKVEADKRDVPEYNPRPLRSEISGLPQRDVEPLPLRTTSDNYDLTIPPPPKPPKNRDCICGKLFGLIPTHPDKCKCRGNK